MMLHVEDVHVSYGDALALSGVSLEVAAGAIVALVGTNGAGKTSLIRAIAGIHPARAGRIVFQGRDVARLAPPQICDLGIAGRSWAPTVLSMTVQDNLSWARCYCAPEQSQANVGRRLRAVSRLRDRRGHCGHDVWRRAADAGDRSLSDGSTGANYVR